MHLIVREIIDGGISRYMQKLGGYSTYFNNRYDGRGSLSQRYTSVSIEIDEQWEPGWKQFQVKNKKRVLEKLKQYPWSTYPTYIGKNRFLDSINRDFFLDFFWKRGEMQAGCRKLGRLQGGGN
ncbi:MAG: hypothetical protein V5A57_03680 [Candidatus Paceibacterota bacterium]